MLKLKLLHPEILMALATNGHGARILIADGNFPVATCPPAGSKKVFLNFAPDLLKVTDVLKVIKEYIPIEAGIVIVPADGSKQLIHDEYQKILRDSILLSHKNRDEFYQEVKSEDTALVIATGDTKRFANILITIGCLMPADG